MIGLIEIKGVSKRIDSSQILKDVNLSIVKGSILGLIGPNGAGKTSLIKIITGIWQADQGLITVGGSEVFENKKTKELIGYVPDQSHYYDSFRVKEMIMFYQLAYEKFNQAKFEEYNTCFQIPLYKVIRELSKGTKAKLALMFNLSIMPEVLILDEPTSGLDPLAKRKLIEIILDDVAEHGTTVLISTHNMGDVEQICDRIAIIDQGQIKFQGSVEEMKRNVRKLQVVFNNKLPSGILNHKDILSVKNTGSVYYIITREYSEDFERLLQASGAFLIEEIDLNLEEIFIHSFGGDSFYEQLTKQSTAL